MVCCIPAPQPHLSKYSIKSCKTEYVKGSCPQKKKMECITRGWHKGRKTTPKSEKSLKILFFNDQNSDWVKKYMHIVDADTISALWLIKQVREQLPLANTFKYFSKVSKVTHHVIVNVANLPFHRQHFKDNFSVKYIIKEVTRYQTTY